MWVISLVSQAIKRRIKSKERDRRRKSRSAGKEPVEKRFRLSYTHAPRNLLPVRKDPHAVLITAEEQNEK
jgi:hypothetical protein